MTTRPGNAALGMWLLHRAKRPCDLVAITRTDGEVARFTNHDRTVTFLGTQFVPVTFAGMSAERREAALRSGNQELYGVIDGNYVLLPDLLGDLYRGAEVAHVVTDWSRPWLWVARHRKRIRNVNWTGTQWVATLESQAQIMTRPAGGRFGGVWAPPCPYKLGGPGCGRDISAWEIPTATVQTVVDSRMVVRFSVASWPGTWVDDEYRDGEVEWLTGDNAGVVSPIVRYVHSTREVELLLPTKFRIQVGDTAIGRVGCNGLATTCKDKFDWLDNHGGDALQPSAAKIVEPPGGQ